MVGEGPDGSSEGQDRVPATDAGASPAAGRVVAVRQGPVLATSFHPELTGDGRVHALFVDMIQEARG